MTSLDIAFADTVATLQQCAEAAQRPDGHASLDDVARCVSSVADHLVAEIRSAEVARRIASSPLHPVFATIFAAVSAPDPDEGATYLAVDEDGTFREARRGQTRASVVADIATGEYEAEQVLRLKGPICEDVTEVIAAEVLERLRRDEPGPVLFTCSNRPPFIPALLFERLPDEAEALRVSWMTPAERRAERDEINTDHAYEAMRDRMMDAAE